MGKQMLSIVSSANPKQEWEEKQDLVSLSNTVTVCKLCHISRCPSVRVLPLVIGGYVHFQELQTAMCMLWDTAHNAEKLQQPIYCVKVHFLQQERNVVPHGQSTFVSQQSSVPEYLFYAFFQPVPMSHHFLLTWLIDTSKETDLALGV